MTTPGSIIIGCSLVAASVLVNLGYSVHRDQVAARERQQAIDDSKKASRATQSIAAWDVAAKGLDSDLQQWLESSAHLRDGEYIRLRFVSIKTFNFPDVQWTDDRHVRVNGYIEATGDKTDQWFSWAKNMYLTDEGGWTDPKAHTTFASISLTKGQDEGWLIRAIRLPD